MKQTFIKISSIGNHEDVTAVYDISKLAFASTQDDTHIKIILDGVEQIWNFASRQDRDRNFKEIIEIIDQLNKQQ